jgi:hypothetical protein
MVTRQLAAALQCKWVLQNCSLRRSVTDRDGASIVATLTAGRPRNHGLIFRRAKEIFPSLKCPDRPRVPPQPTIQCAGR